MFAVLSGAAGYKELYSTVGV